jgi:tetratricopeptide (TPR) repeat protein
MRIRGAGVVLSLVCSIALCGAVAGARADTIVLKNGRRIVVDRATESGDKVVGETQAGEISLPKSMVERIEHSSAAIPTTVATDRTTSAGFVIAPPATQTELTLDPEVAQAAVHDGAVDKVYIARLDGAAVSGAPGAASRAAAAHYAAAEFETQKGNLSAAVDQERQALRFLPNSVPLLVGAAYGYLKLSEYSTALEYLTRAKRSAPDSPDVAKLSGWAEYGLNHIPEAVQEWKHAQQLRPDPEVAKALEKAERDARAENDFRQGQTSHFVLRYSGAAQPGLAADILGTLEIHFEQIASLLDYTPPEPIGVILYTNEQFEDITRAPAWAGAINDGRLRIPVQGLTSVSQQLSLVLRHELTHSFLQQKTRGRCPPWLHEGIAQWIEGRRVGPAAAGLLGAYDHQAGIPLTDLEVSWMSLSGTGASYAYAWSLAVVETILANNSMADLVRMLDALTASGSTEGAVRSVLHESYTELEQQTADYLRSTYGRNQQ